MKLPTTSEILFSLKCLAASLLALYVALAFALPRPFWAMMTCYIIANPFSGPVRSKAVFRVMGTVLGSIATVILVPQLANAPELLSLALALWVGLCLFISLLDRTPRSYIFLLAGYTAALIGFPSVNDPSVIFDVALARVEEISIGIVCGSVVHGLVFPQSWGPVMFGRVRRVVGDIQQTLRDVFAGADRQRLQNDKRMLASDIAELRALAIHLPFDTSHLRWTADAIYAMHERLSVLLPLLSGVRDRLEQCRAAKPSDVPPSTIDKWDALLLRIQQWSMQSHATQDNAQRSEEKRLIEEAINALMPTIDAKATWFDLLQLNLVRRLTELVRVMDDVLTLYTAIESSATGVFPSSQAMPAKQGHLLTPLHHDYWMATMSATAAIVAILGCCVFWIETGWPSGGVSAMMAAVFCCLFAVQDNPVPSLKTFLYFTLLSVPLSALYVLWILPTTHSFETMALCVAPLLFILGVYLARPQHGLKSLSMTLGVLGSFALQDNIGVDVGVFMNATIAQTIGVIVALIITGLISAVNSDWRARRLIAAGRQDLVDLVHSTSAPQIATIAAKMMDRVAQLAPRLSALPQTSTASASQDIDALLDFRLSLNVVQLLRFRSSLKEEIGSLKPLFRELGVFLSTSTHDGQRLLTCIDDSIREIASSKIVAASTQGDEMSSPQDASTAASTALTALSALTALTAIRRDLFPDAVAYAPITSTNHTIAPADV